MSRFTDISSTGWVARLPHAWLPYAHLARIDRPIGVWLLFLPGLWSILAARAPWGETVWLIALFLLGSLLMRSAGCTVNDMWDREMDRKVTRTATRPLASGALRLRHAATFLAIMLAASLVILLQLNPLAQALGVFSLLLVVTYPLAKRVTWWPQAMLGLTFGWGAPMGYAAAAGHLGATPALLYAAAISWILGYDTIYAHQDREDDALIGLGSTARTFGERSRPFLVFCYFLAVAFAGTAIALAGGRAFAFAGLAGFAAHLAYQVARFDMDDPDGCLTLFRSNREAGLILFAGLVSDALIRSL